MVSPETAWSSGASGTAADAETAARLRQIANADAKSIFMAIFPSLQICRDAAVAHGRKTLWRPGNGKRPLPVTAVPAAPVMPMPVMPAAMPVMVPMMSPADFLGLEVPDLG